jgi:hypothetical protein
MRVGRIQRQCRRCLIVHDGEATTDQLRQWAWARHVLLERLPITNSQAISTARDVALDWREEGEADRLAVVAATGLSDNPVLTVLIEQLAPVARPNSPLGFGAWVCPAGPGRSRSSGDHSRGIKQQLC